MWVVRPACSTTGCDVHHSLAVGTTERSRHRLLTERRDSSEDVINAGQVLLLELSTDVEDSVDDGHFTCIGFRCVQAYRGDDGVLVLAT